MSAQGIFATEDLATAGALIYWRLDGALDAAVFAEAWSLAGLPEKHLPETPAPSTALARAIKELADKHTLVRPLGRRVGHAVVTERAKGKDLDYSVELKVELDQANKPRFEPAWHPSAERVVTEFGRHLLECSPEDVGNWLVRVVKRLDGLALRDTGGFYYLPPSSVVEWEHVADVLMSVSKHKLFKIPAMKSQDALHSILDAIEQDARREAEAMEAELEASRMGKTALGERAIANRYTRVEATERRVERYEGLLGQRLDGLRDRLNELRAGLAAASLSSSLAEDAFGGSQEGASP